MCHRAISSCWCAETLLFRLTCFSSTADKICASRFFVDIRFFNYSIYLVHGHYSAFLLLDIFSSWSLVDVSVTWHIGLQSMTITLRFCYSAFPNPAKTQCSTFQLLDVSVLQWSSFLSSFTTQKSTKRKSIKHPNPPCTCSVVVKSNGGQKTFPLASTRQHSVPAEESYIHVVGYAFLS